MEQTLSGFSPLYLLNVLLNAGDMLDSIFGLRLQRCEVHSGCLCCLLESKPNKQLMFKHNATTDRYRKH